MKILALDDDEIALKLLEGALKSAGYVDTTFKNCAEDAFEALSIEETSFDCFLVDIVMPGIDGIQFVRHVRGLANYQDAPILMITASSEKQNIDSAFKEGATDYITKPFDPIELVTRLNLAQKMIAARRELSVYRSQSNHPNLPTAKKDSGDYGVPYSLNINGFVEYDSFQNYISKLSRSELLRLCVASIGIEDFAYNFSDFSKSEIEQTLTKIGFLISKEFGVRQKVFSYPGHGLFFCCYRGRVSDFDSETLSAIQKSVDFEFSNSIGSIEILCSAVRRIGLSQSEDPLQFFRFEYSYMAKRTESYVSETGPQIDGVEPVHTVGEVVSDISAESLGQEVKALVPKFLSILSENMLDLEIYSTTLENSLLTSEQIGSVITLSHKIAGVAPMLGFSALGTAAKDLEDFANLKFDGGSKEPSNLEIKMKIEAFLDEIENVLVENMEFFAPSV